MMFEAILSGYRWLFLQLASFLGIGWAIVALSVICSVLMTPLMRAVSGIVKREKEYEDVILPQIEAINKTYDSDMERNLHIQRLYFRYAYSPLCAVKKVLPLFVQIPFLLLTYYMLKDTAEINGVRFLFLRDLGKPDGLITMMSVNVLPLVMTVVNIITVFATPGFTKKDWTQAIGISLLFLVLLYTAPSALLLYWTLNNVISLFKVLFPNRFAGTRLLAARFNLFASDHPLNPKMILVSLKSPSPEGRIRLAYASLVLTLLSLYMYLMVRMEVWWFNYMVSFWFMNVVLTLVLVINYFLLRNEGHICWILSGVVAGMGLVVTGGLVCAMGAMIKSFAVFGFIATHVNMAHVYEVLFVLGAGALVMSTGKSLGELCSDVFHVVKAEGQWLVVPILLAVHYAFASEHFKLPPSSVVFLSLELIVPGLLLALLFVALYRRLLQATMVFKILVGVLIGFLLIPMVSMESGKLTGWQSNFLIRIGVISAVAWGLTKFTSRKTSWVFISLLGAVMVFNTVRNATDVSEPETQPQGTSTFSGDTAVLETLTCQRTNNVYLLVFDSYSHDIILDGLGIKRDDTKDWLKKNGFTDYCAYSIGYHTIAGMGTMFTVGGVQPGSWRSMMAGNNVLCDVMRRSGYKTSYVLSGYDMPNKGEKMPGDYYFPAPQEGKRPDLVLLPLILAGYLSQSPNTFNDYTDEEWEAAKRKVLAEAVMRRSFVYTHVFAPGHAIANPIYRKSDAEEIARFEKGLEDAHRRMRRDVSFILEKDPTAVVIVASDHGAYLMVPSDPNHFDARHLLDRNGVQLLVHWPSDYRPVLPKIRCLPDATLELLIYLTGDKSLVRFQSDGANLENMYPVKVGPGSIKDSIIQIGDEKGQNVFEAAKRDFSEEEVR